MEHKLEKVKHEGTSGHEYHCTVCLWTWKAAPASNCPGLPRRSAPHLLTYTQLQKKHLKPADRNKPDACYYQNSTRDFVWLYDERVALPRRQDTQKQKAAREKAWVTTQEKYRCTECKRAPKYLGEVRQYTAGGLCDSCASWAEEEAKQEAQEAMIRDDGREACAWAAALLQRTDWCILDTETTDLSGYVVELAVLAPDGRVLLQSVVNPQNDIHPDARRVHRISDEEVLLAPTLPEIWPDLLAALEGRTTLVAYNSEFDEETLARDAARYGLVLPNVEWDDLMEQYAAVYGEYSEYWGDYKWQRLPGGSHRALGDCRASHSLLTRMAVSLESYKVDA